MSYRLIIFDFDGTLVDSGPWMARALNGVAAQFGFRQVGEAEIEALRGRDSRSVIRELGVPLWRLPAIARHMRRLVEESDHTPPLFPGIAAMLQAVAAGRTLAVVSSNTERAIRRALGPELAGLFAVYACEASMFGKRAKFRRVLKLTGIPASAALAIGDETRDIEAARAAGVACGGVTWGYATPELVRSQAPDHLFESPADIMALAPAG